MNDYTKGILTGASLILCFFMLVSAKSQSKNLGDIIVNSIMVLDDGNGGAIRTFNAEGKETAYLGTAENGGGFLKIYNKHEVMTGYFGSNKDNDGMAFLKDRYGDIGWSASGKK